MTALALLFALAADPPPADKFAEARKLVEPIRAIVGSGAAAKPAELVPDPVMVFTDPTQNHTEGHVWVWGKTGRPAAIMEVFVHADFGRRSYTGHATTTEPLDAKAPELGFLWKPAAPDLEFAAFPNAPAPAVAAPARLLQMKALARRTAGVEFWPPGNRLELRLLPTPIHRYAEPAAGIVDGSFFAFVSGGTNPEIVMALEATGTAAKSEWRWAAVRMGHAEMRLALDGKELWTKPQVFERSWSDAYTAHTVRAAAAARPAGKAVPDAKK